MFEVFLRRSMSRSIRPASRRLADESLQRLVKADGSDKSDKSKDSDKSDESDKPDTFHKSENRIKPIDLQQI